MAGDARAAEGVPPPREGGAGLRVALLCARFNSEITLRLLGGARRGLAACGVAAVDEHWVAGAFELPFAARACCRGRQVDAVVCLGAVIRGETSHYDLVAGECARGIQEVQLQLGLPVGFGVLTTEDLDQALARSEGPGGHNVGEDAARAAVDSALLARDLAEAL